MCLLCIAAVGIGRGQGRTFPQDGGALPLDGTPLGGTLRWTGVAGLRIDVEGTSIAFDPFVTRPGLFSVLCRRPRPDGALAAARYGNLDAVFAGHSHYDHAMDLPAVAAASPGAVIHGSRTTVELCRRAGVPETQLRTVGPGDRIRQGPFAVEVVASEHGVVPVVGRFDRMDLGPEGFPRTPFRFPRGAVFAFRIEVGGRRLHLQGSAGIDAEALARQEEVDVLLPCLAARHGTPDYFERLGERLRPKLLVPIHHDDFFRPLGAPPRTVKTLDWPGFLEDARRLETRWGTRLFCPPLDADVAW